MPPSTREGILGGIGCGKGEVKDDQVGYLKERGSLYEGSHLQRSLSEDEDSLDEGALRLEEIASRFSVKSVLGEEIEGERGGLKLRACLPLRGKASLDGVRCGKGRVSLYEEDPLW